MSVVLPVHNGEPALAATMDALVAQTCASMEIVVVDDGSTDASAEILSRYDDDPRVTVVHQANQGVWQARKQGIARTSGRYLGFCDADDLPHPRLWETLLDKAETDGGEMVVTAYRRIVSTDHHLRGVEMRRPDDTVVVPASDPGGFASVNTSLWNKLFDGDMARRVASALDEDRLHFDPIPRRGQDMLFLALCLPWVKKVTFTHEPLYDYLIRPDATITMLTPTEAEHLAGNLREIRAWVTEHCDADDVRALATVVDTMAFVHLGLSALVSMNANASMSRRATRAYWQQMRARLDREFPYYRDRVPGAHTATKLKLAQWFDKRRMLVAATRAYVVLTKLTRRDARW
ncbi:MAG: glycosyltransferase [Micrococcales bacterium]|nr:glycosyltransferase [Micrococcales bacterium]